MRNRERCHKLLENALGEIPQENNQLDWKVALTSHPERFKKHLSAMANNRNGGFIIFGIDDKTGELKGVSKEEVKDIQQKLASLARHGVEPAVILDFFFINFRGTELFVCQINEAIRFPVFIKNGDKTENPYLRAAGQSRPMTAEEIVTYSRLNDKKSYWESTPNLALKNWEEQLDFSPLFALLKRTYSSTQAANEFLFAHHCLSSVDGVFYPTNLGILAAATKVESDFLSIRLLQYRDKSRLKVKYDRFFNKGFLFSIDQIMSAIEDLLPSSEEISLGTRYTKPILPLIAIREALSNAIIHRDYQIQGLRITIELFEDRLEITNPGGLLLEMTIDRLIDHPSMTRNEQLADLMRLAGLAEERGSGIDKMVHYCELENLPPIKFKNEKTYFNIIFFFPKKFNDLDKSERVEAVYQHACLNFVNQQKTTNFSLRKRFSFSDNENTKTSRLIKDAILLGRIRLANPTDRQKDYHYIPYWA